MASIQSPKLEASVLDTAAAIARMDNDPAMYWEVFPIFMEETAQHIEQLEDALDASDVRRCRLMAHSIKSSAATIGAEQMRMQAANAEQAALAEDLALLSNLLPELVACYEAVLMYAERALGESR